MIADLRHGDPGDAVHAGVAIVGAGPAGITLAIELADAGVDVVLLEAGGERYDAAGQEHYRAAAVDPPSHGPVHLFRRRNLGGSTAVWGGRCIPFDPIDFEARPWIRSADWPIGHADVAAHYDRAAQWCEAGPARFAAADALPGRPAALAPGVESTDVVLDRIERFSPPTDFGRRYRQRLQTDPRIRVLLHAPAVEVLTLDGGSRVAGLAVRHGERRLEVRAPRVVLAAGGIETPRLLLASDREQRGGLGNGHGLVGRYYQCHLEGEIGRIRFLGDPAAVRADYEVSPEGVYCRRYLWLAPAAQRRERLAGLIVRPNHVNIVDPDHREAVLSAMYLVKSLIVPEYARKLTSLEAQALAELRAHWLRFHAAHLRNLACGAPRLLAFAAMWARRRVFARRKLPSVVLADPRGVYALEVNAEQEPNPDSRITLAAERDALGMRRVRVDWRTTEQDHRRLACGLRTLQAALAGSATVRLDFDGVDLDAAARARVPVGGHHIGTARMGRTPATGVCDGHGEVFGTRGLYIAGAASFTTSGFANPTLTIVALCVRMARHLAGRG